jgi:hypothetical protein
MLDGVEPSARHRAPFPDVLFSFEVVYHNQVEDNVLSRRGLNHHTRKA